MTKQNGLKDVKKIVDKQMNILYNTMCAVALLIFGLRW